jgi:lysophospholipase L1-like esterase
MSAIAVTRKGLILGSVFVHVLTMVTAIWVVQRLGGPNYFLTRIRNHNRATITTLRMQIYPRLPLPEDATVFTGDSLIAQGMWSELLNDPKIYNRGLEGGTVRWFVENLGGVLPSRVDRLFLSLGHNDLADRGPSEVIRDFETLLQLIEKRQLARVVTVSSCLPTNDEVGRVSVTNERIMAYNDLLRPLVAKHGMAYVNADDVLGAPPDGRLRADFTTDGTHLSAAAYLAWAQALRQTPMFQRAR